LPDDGEGEAAAELPAPFWRMAAEPGHSALFLDFDGTLAAIVEDPTGARPLPGIPALLADLARPFALVAVVSGRPTAFLSEVLGAPAGVTLAGLYGLERALHGPEHAAWSSVIDEVVAEARAEAPPGVYVEPKGLTVTLHWRRAPEHRDWVLTFAERQHAQRGLTVYDGRTERELRPPLQVDKGTVVRSLAAEHAGQLRAVAVFGDDIGDLPAFDAVGELRASDGSPLAAVRVAAVDAESPPEVAARADLTVDGATGAVELLRALADAAAAAAAPPQS
jgi:trehalose 6-phosphate phosphatase